MVAKKPTSSKRVEAGLFALSITAMGDRLRYVKHWNDSRTVTPHLTITCHC